MQPASGARDLNPQQVELNHLIATKLSNVYKLWGYEEVSPPNIERLETLMAGGAISDKDILKLVSDESLGLRPEMTASIARAASTRLINKPRPLRLWSKGTIFKTKEVPEGGTYIEESLQSGVELFGTKNIYEEIELLSLLLESMKVLNMNESHKPTLLIGHKQLMDLILSKYNSKDHKYISSILINYDQISIEELKITEEAKNELLEINKIRGRPKEVFSKIRKYYGNQGIIKNLEKLFEIICPISDKYNVRLQLDPTFQTKFDLYNGLIFQLVCQGPSNQVVIARGGRYDEIVNRFSNNEKDSNGIGFSFAIDKTREIILEDQIRTKRSQKILIAFGPNKTIEDAIAIQRKLHSQGYIAIVHLEECQDKAAANEILNKRQFSKLEWLK